MKLTGKCKADFEKWYLKNNTHSRWVNFEICGDSMQYGVYVDYFDSVDIRAEITVHPEITMQGLYFKKFKATILFNGEFINVPNASNLRERMRTQVIEKADKTRNEQL